VLRILLLLLLWVIGLKAETIVFDPQQIWAANSNQTPSILEPLYLNEGNTYVFNFYRLRDTYSGTAYNPSYDWVTSKTSGGAYGFLDCFVKLESQGVTDSLVFGEDTWRVNMITKRDNSNDFKFSSQDNKSYNSFNEDPARTNWINAENNWIFQSGYQVDNQGAVEIEVLSGGGFLTGLSFGIFQGDYGVFSKNILIPIPEPSALSLIAVSLGALALVRRRRS